MEFDHITHAQRVVFGTGKAVQNTVSLVAESGARRVLLIAGGHTSTIADRLAEQIPVAARIEDVVQHVPVARAHDAAADARASGADAIVCVGGGSATGLAKAVALETALPILAVPTTFAGSEATEIWGLTEAGHKTTGSDPRVLPGAVVYDAALLVGLPPHLAVASGLNAIAHAVDGFWAPRADPINRALGAEGMRALITALPALADSPSDVDLLEQALYGAYLAGIAFASAGSGMHHKICHVLGGLCNLPHAETHSIVLGYVTAFNAPYAPDAAARISAAFDGADAGRALFELRAKLPGPRSLAEIGLDESAIPEAAARAHAAIPPSNPRPVTVEAVRKILRLAWAGEPPVEGRS